MVIASQGISSQDVIRANRTTLKAVFVCASFFLFVPAGVAAVDVVEVSDGPPAERQDGSPPDSTVTYSAVYFSQYDPVTALDMLDRIPGVDSILSDSGGNGRGLGTGDAILINGKRIAGKENSGRDMLERIAASQVGYFEIIRGTSANLDVRSAGPIVNVVMNEGAARPGISAEISTEVHQNGTARPGGAISLGAQSSAFDYLLNYAAQPNYEYQIRDEYSVHSDGTPKDIILQERERKQIDHTLTGNFGYQFNERNLLQLNALYAQSDSRETVDRTLTEFGSVPAQLAFQRENPEWEQNQWEFGGNYQHMFAGGARFKFIFVLNEETETRFYERFELAPSTRNKTLYVAHDQRDRERIARASYTRKIADDQDIEFGLEGALTTLDKSFRLGSGASGVPSPRFGNLVPASDVESTVGEVRYEPFAIHNWQISSAATLESTLIAEFSEIEQKGTENGVPVGKTRDFYFLKPKLDYRYEISDSTQLRATLERHVSQLSFSSFSASNSNDLDKDINAGNPGLEQEKSWRYELNWEHRLLDNGGVLNSRLFYHDIEDVIGKVSVSRDPMPLISAQGNIGGGRRYGLELDASLHLDAFDLPDTMLTAGGLVQDSQVVDPFLKETRRLDRENRGRLSLGLRHDIPAWKVNYGADYRYYLPGRLEVDIDTVVRSQVGSDASMFIEKVVFEGVTARLESTNLLDSANCYQGTRYLGATADGIMEEREDYCFTYGRLTALKVKATF